MRWPIAMPSSAGNTANIEPAALPTCSAPSRHSDAASDDGQTVKDEAEHLHQLVLGQPDGLEVRPRRE